VRFKQFLEARINSYEHEPQDGGQLLDTLRTHCMKSLRTAQAGNMIYRGSRSALKSGVYDPGLGLRKSQNTTNYYTVFLDTNPRNRGFPKRSQSFICSTRKGKAKQYVEKGTLLNIFPYDQTKIGVCDDDDIWGLELHFKGFLKTFHLVDFNDFWDDLCDDLGKSPGSLQSLDDAQFMLRSARQEQVIKALHREGLLHGIDSVGGPSDREIVDNFITSLPDAYSYKQLRCRVVDPDEIPEIGSEVWFSGKCVAVTENDMDMVREEFGL